MAHLPDLVDQLYARGALIAKTPYWNWHPTRSDVVGCLLQTGSVILIPARLGVMVVDVDRCPHSPPVCDPCLIRLVKRMGPNSVLGWWRSGGRKGGAHLVVSAANHRGGKRFEADGVSGDILYRQPCEVRDAARADRLATLSAALGRADGAPEADLDAIGRTTTKVRSGSFEPIPYTAAQQSHGGHESTRRRRLKNLKRSCAIARRLAHGESQRSISGSLRMRSRSPVRTVDSYIDDHGTEAHHARFRVYKAWLDEVGRLPKGVNRDIQIARYRCIIRAAQVAMMGRKARARAGLSAIPPVGGGQKSGHQDAGKKGSVGLRSSPIPARSPP